MERETKIITTPARQHKVEILTYITGREQREINGAIYNSGKVKVVDGQPVIDDIDTKEMVNAIQDTTIDALIISIDGKKENIKNTVLDMLGEDYDFLMEELNEVRNGKKKE